MPQWNAFLCICLQMLIKKKSLDNGLEEINMVIILVISSYSWAGVSECNNDISNY